MLDGRVFFSSDKEIFRSNPDGLQGKATQYGGKKTGQTAFNGCEYRFLVRLRAPRRCLHRPSSRWAAGTMTRVKWGLRSPTPRATFSFGGKGTKRPPGEGPRSPRHRPPGDTLFIVYLPFAVAGLILPVVPALRLPPFSVYPRVLTVDMQRLPVGRTPLLALPL